MNHQARAEPGTHQLPSDHGGGSRQIHRPTGEEKGEGAQIAGEIGGLGLPSGLP
jgi:hypothetical protein